MDRQMEQLDKQLEFIHVRNKFFVLFLAVLFTIGCVIELTTRKVIPVALGFVFSSSVFYFIYFFLVINKKWIKQTMYFVIAFLVLFSSIFILNDRNIVIYISALMLFTFISFYEQLVLSIISAIIMNAVSNYVLFKEAANIFTAEVLTTPDILVFSILIGFISISLIYQNYLARKMRLQLYRSEEKISFLAYHDELTGLKNRFKFDLELTNYFDRFSKQSISKDFDQLVLMMIDLDNFKKVNDTMGHDVGNMLLIEVANRLKNSVRDNDILGRIGGDEFTILLPFPVNRKGEGQDALASSILIAEKVLECLQKPMVINEVDLINHFKVTASIGIAAGPSHYKDAAMMFKNADIAMYHAKKNGKNRYYVYNSINTHQLYRNETVN